MKNREKTKLSKTPLRLPGGRVYVFLFQILPQTGRANCKTTKMKKQATQIRKLMTGGQIAKPKNAKQCQQVCEAHFFTFCLRSWVLLPAPPVIQLICIFVVRDFSIFCMLVVLRSAPARLGRCRCTCCHAVGREAPLEHAAHLTCRRRPADCWRHWQCAVPAGVHT